MPIYEYRCEQCGHELEAIQSMSDEPLSDCPECNTASLQRKISAAGFRLKGSGWYETDFKSGNRRNVAESGGASESGKSGDSGSGSSSSSSASSGGSCSHGKASA